MIRLNNISALAAALFVTATTSARLLIFQATGGFHEYAAVYLYLSDCIAIIFIILSLRAGAMGWLARMHKGVLFMIIFFLLSSLVSSLLSYSFALSISAYIHLLIAALAAISLAQLAGKRGMMQVLLGCIVIVTTAQAALGVYQFSTQGSLGLYRLGEPELVSSAGSTSTIKAEGGRFIRAYGLLPHPNVLGVWLAVGLVAAAALFVRLDSKLYQWDKSITMSGNFVRFITHRDLYYRLLLAAAMFVLVFGLAVTFSRAGWIAAVCGIIFFIIAGVKSRMHLRSLGRLVAVLVLAGLAVYHVIAPLIVSRAQISRAEQAVDYRLQYSRMGMDIAAHRPLGVGIGTQVFFSVTEKLYQQRGMMQLWQWEPIHSLYLLIAAEIGIAGLLSFIALLAMVMWLLLKEYSFEAVAATGLVATVATAGLFDHLLWDIQSGRLLLWIVIGLALSVHRQRPVRRRHR